MSLIARASKTYVSAAVLAALDFDAADRVDYIAQRDEDGTGSGFLPGAGGHQRSSSPRRRNPKPISVSAGCTYGPAPGPPRPGSAETSTDASTDGWYAMLTNLDPEPSARYPPRKRRARRTRRDEPPQDAGDRPRWLHRDRRGRTPSTPGQPLSPDFQAP